MNDQFENLINILEKEVILYNEFLNILQNERQYMIDLSLDRLHECSNYKETVILKLHILEDSRKDVISLIQNGHNSSPTLAVIIDEAPARYRKGLESCRSNLISLVNSIKEINQINGILADRVINYTRNSLSFLNRLVYELPVYQPTGQMGQDKKTGKLVCKRG